jgi:hypothetical protein
LLVASFGCPARSRLKELSLPAAGFAVKLPGSPQKETTEIAGVKATAFTIKEGEGLFSVQYSEGPKLTNPTKAELQEYFAQWRKNFLASTDAKVKEERDANLDDKHPGHYWEVEITDKRIKQQVRVILADSKTYVLMATGLSSWSGWRDAKQVLNSFRLLGK